MKGAGCFGGGLLFLALWFLSTAVMAWIAQWVLGLFGVHIPFWPAFVVVFVLGFFMGGSR